jgi:predicted AAA+ superfamily ATPase|nr:ATP-binding protein [Candidatus Krumholzibacteria bacterium]
MNPQKYYPRLVQARLREALEDSPVVLLHGPRQCGKTTLAKGVGGQEGRQYITLDDPVTLTAVQSDPSGFVLDLNGPVTIDEVQRVPALFLAIKQAVDRDRRPGRFLLTGSANAFFVPGVADSLAGRMEIVRLHPLSEVEIGSHRPGFLDRLFAGDFMVAKGRRLGPDLSDLVARGGFPEAVRRESARGRRAWAESYIEAIIQRDVQDFSRIQRLDILPRLLEFAAGQTSRLVNVSGMAGPFGVSRTTVREYLTLLGQLFLVEELPAWHNNRLKRLVKAPKLHLTDTGLACALLGVEPEDLRVDRKLLGQLLETFVYQELRRQVSGWDHKVRFSHFRDKEKQEVDIVLERGPGRVVGIEVKAAATLKDSDRRGLERLRDATGSSFRCGALLYDGETLAPLGDRIYAIPLSFLWNI